MLLTLIIQIFFLSYFFKEKEVKSKKAIYFFSIWLTVIVILLFWRVFNLQFFNKNTLLLLSISQYRLNSIMTVLGAILVTNFVQLYLSFRELKLFEKQHMGMGKRSLVLISLMLPVVIGLLLLFSSHWAVQTFDNLSFEQIVFMLSEPLEGTDPNQIYKYIYSPILNTVFISSLLFLFFNFCLTYRLRIPIKSRGKIKCVLLSFVSLLVFFIGSGMGINKIGYADIKSYYFENTNLYEKYYTDTSQQELVFPEKKRNLIYIFLESMESSYSSIEYGGIREENLIPNLTQLALEEGVHFSNTDKLGGILTSPGTGTTASSMVAQTSGVPLVASMGKMTSNDYGDKGELFLPGAYSLGEVLEKENYNQMLFIGSESSFAGRKKYFTQHGNYQIRDYVWAKEQGLIPQDYKVWWGYEDRKLFSFAKESLIELSEKNEPFNFTMLTTDTHFEDGYATEETPNLFGDQYSNVIYDNDRQVSEFIEWIKQQKFYDNTTIVVVGDHLTMDIDFFNNIDEEYQRSIYNVFLNVPDSVEVNTTKNRVVTTVDFFPTTLAALGVQIPEERLALGTNLFSARQTVAEELGYSSYLNELKKKSDFYSKEIMRGTDDKLLDENE